MIAPTALVALAEQFEILRLHCTIELQKDGNLPNFKGSMLHGWLGHALKGQDAPLYHLFYGEHASNQPKPYFVRVANDYRQRWHRGEMWSFEIVLLGSACRMAERLVTALVASTPLGLGPQRLPFNLQSIASVLPNRLKPGLHSSQLLDWLQPVEPRLDGEIALQLHSPLRLKHKGSIIKDGIPDLSLLVQQASRRLALLSTFWVNDNPELLSALKHSLPYLGDYHSQGSKMYFEDWLRHSVRQNELLPFGGLMGQLCYQGDIVPAISWLQVGEQLHIGGKTTFGLGQYQLMY